MLGKLLVAFGPERILWGTDSIWYGSPQDQIAAFRAFEITPAFQERFGYPALTPDVKRRILGRNAVELFGITPPAGGCATPAEQAARRPTQPDARPGVARATSWPTFLREHPSDRPPAADQCIGVFGAAWPPHEDPRMQRSTSDAG